MTDEELGAELRRLQAAQSVNHAARVEACARRDEFNAELDRLHGEASKLHVQVTALVFGQCEADLIAFRLDVNR